MSPTITADPGLFSDDSLRFVFPISECTSIVTVVFGPGYQQAVVALVVPSAVVWSATLTPSSARAEIPVDLNLCKVSIMHGATFTLTPPSGTKMGNVLFSGTISREPGIWLPIDPVVALWSAPATETA